MMLPFVIRRTQNDPFTALGRDFDRVVRNYFGDGETPAALAPYAVDLHEDHDHFYVEAELPGFTKDEVDITLEDGILSIKAERKSETPEQKTKKGEPLHVERNWTRFERTFTLPTAVNENAVKAELDHGVLKITLDKREEVKPRKIQIATHEALPANGNGSAKKTVAP